MATEDKSPLPLISSQGEKEIDTLRNNENGTLKATHKWTGFQGKTLWDWLQLLGVLAIPLVVALATILFGLQQAHLADLQHISDQQIAQKQHEADKQRALDQQQAAILQTYMDNIQDLLLNHNLLGDSPMPKNDADKVKIQEVRALARSRTLTALQGLDPHRKRVLLQFIYEARLIGFPDSQGKPQKAIVALFGADLTYADLSHADFSEADLSSANLNYATLNGITLIGTYLIYTTLIDAHLSNADLSSANLFGANLFGADLNNAILASTDLRDANFTQEQLDHVKSCKAAILINGLTCNRL